MNINLHSSTLAMSSFLKLFSAYKASFLMASFEKSTLFYKVISLYLHSLQNCHLKGTQWCILKIDPSSV